MQKSLANLPPKQQTELASIVKNIHRVVKVEFILLFGSAPRGTFVEHNETFVEGHTEIYESDFDILVIVRNEKKEMDFNL